jgi:hypothetical protein
MSILLYIQSEFRCSREGEYILQYFRFHIDESAESIDFTKCKLNFQHMYITEGCIQIEDVRADSLQI